MQITTSCHQDNSNHLFYAFSFQHVDTTSEEGILAETFLDACRNIVPMFGKYFVTTIKLIKRHEKKKSRNVIEDKLPTILSEPEKFYNSMQP